MRAVLKWMPPILQCWPITSEADVGGMAVEAEPPYQHCVTCCCCMTNGSRGAVWQNDSWYGSEYEEIVGHWIPPCEKKGHPLTSTDVCWKFMETKQWLWAQWGSGWCSSGDRESGSHPWVQIFTSVAYRLLFIAGKNAELMVVTMLEK